MRRKQAWSLAAAAVVLFATGHEPRAEKIPLRWEAKDGCDEGIIRLPNEGDGCVEIAEVAGKRAVQNSGDGSFFIYIGTPVYNRPPRGEGTVPLCFA